MRWLVGRIDQPITMMMTTQYSNVHTKLSMLRSAGLPTLKDSHRCPENELSNAKSIVSMSVSRDLPSLYSTAAQSS